MSPQRSSRNQLIEGTLRCLEELPRDRITSRAIAQASHANLASIAYHFGSKDNLITEAVVTGLDRWLAEIASALEELPSAAPNERMRRAFDIVDATRDKHLPLARNFVGALATAQHDPRVRANLAAGFRRTRRSVADLLGLGEDGTGEDAGALALALFYGLLIQELLDRKLAVTGLRMVRAQARLRTVLPEEGPGPKTSRREPPGASHGPSREPRTAG